MNNNLFPTNSFMLNGAFVPTMKLHQRHGPDTHRQKYEGLHINIGVIISIDRNNLTARIVDTTLIERTKTEDFSKRASIEAMIMQINVGMTFNDNHNKPEKFCSDITMPSIGSHAVYAHINGAFGGAERTVILGTVNAQAGNYSFNDLSTKLKDIFAALTLEKLYDSPSGYYSYETSAGNLVEGYFDHIDTADPQEKWKREQFSSGKLIYTIKNNGDDSKKQYEYTLNADGTSTEYMYDSSEKKLYSKEVKSDGELEIKVYNPADTAKGTWKLQASGQLDVNGNFTVDAT